MPGLDAQGAPTWRWAPDGATPVPVVAAPSAPGPAGENRRRSLGCLWLILVPAVLAFVLGPLRGGDDEPRPSPAPVAPANDWQEPTLVALGAIDPRLIENRDRALRRTENSCDAATRLPGQEVEQTRQRFDGGTVAVDTAMAEQIWAVLAEKACPSLTLAN